MVYDVEFISGSYEFDCEVNAMTGEIVKFEKEYDGAAVSNASVEEHGEQSEHSQTKENQAVSNISLEKAKETALDHAGVKATDATFVKAKSDYEDGRAVFEIEFVVSSGNTIKEYDYEIAASDGSIISYDYDIEGDSTPTAIQAGSSQNTSEITLEKAKEIALSHAGVASANAFEMEGKLDWDDGMSIYEIEFKAGGYEYSYEVDAATGSIVEFDKEWDD